MAMSVENLNSFFKKAVTMRIQGSQPHDVFEIDGKILAVSHDGVALRARSNTRIFHPMNIISCVENPRARRKRVVRRWVRVIPKSASVKQHLADRHAVLVTVLNAVDEETARLMHDNTDHGDLGHRHRSPEDRIKDLEAGGEDAGEDEEE